MSLFGSVQAIQGELLIMKKVIIHLRLSFQLGRELELILYLQKKIRV